MQGEEDSGDEEENGLDCLKDMERNGARLVHLLRGLNASWHREFQSITEALQ